MPIMAFTRKKISFMRPWWNGRRSRFKPGFPMGVRVQIPLGAFSLCSRIGICGMFKTSVICGFESHSGHSRCGKNINPTYNYLMITISRRSDVFGWVQWISGIIGNFLSLHICICSFGLIGLLEFFYFFMHVGL